MVTDRQLEKEGFSIYEEPIIGRVASKRSSEITFYYLRESNIVRMESDRGSSYQVDEIKTIDELIMLLIFNTDQKIKTLLMR